MPRVVIPTACASTSSRALLALLLRHLRRLLCLAILLPTAQYFEMSRFTRERLLRHRSQAGGVLLVVALQLLDSDLLGLDDSVAGLLALGSGICQ